MSVPSVVDYLVVKELRINGLYGEADALVKAHQENLFKEKKQLESEILKTDYKKKFVLGVCVCAGCPNARDGKKVHCPTHVEYYRAWNKAAWNKAKAKGTNTTSIVKITEGEKLQ